MSESNSPNAGGLWARLRSIGSPEQTTEEKPAENATVPAPAVESTSAAVALAAEEAIPCPRRAPEPVPPAPNALAESPPPAFPIWKSKLSPGHGRARASAA